MIFKSAPFLQNYVAKQNCIHAVFIVFVIQVRYGSLYQVWLAVQEDCISVLDYATLVSITSTELNIYTIELQRLSNK